MRYLFGLLLVVGVAIGQEIRTDLDLPVNPNHPAAVGTKDIGLRSWGGTQLSQPTASTDIDVPPLPPPPAPPPTDPVDLPPPVIFGEEIPSESDSVWYVIDVSGSMTWDTLSLIGLDGQRRQGNRLDKAKIELSRSILSLPPNFRFNIVAYECMIFPWLNSPVMANDTNKAQALSWVNALQAQGATATGPATAFALFDRTNQLVVLVTDGSPNCGVPAYSTFYTTGWWNESQAFREHRQVIRANNTQGARINVFGIAANGAMREFCQQVAGDSGGSYNDVP